MIAEAIGSAASTPSIVALEPSRPHPTRPPMAVGAGLGPPPPTHPFPRFPPLEVFERRPRSAIGAVLHAPASENLHNSTRQLGQRSVGSAPKCRRPSRRPALLESAQTAEVECSWRSGSGLAEFRCVACRYSASGRPLCWHERAGDRPQQHSELVVVRCIAVNDAIVAREFVHQRNAGTVVSHRIAHDDTRCVKASFLPAAASSVTRRSQSLANMRGSTSCSPLRPVASDVVRDLRLGSCSTKVGNARPSAAMMIWTAVFIFRLPIVEAIGSLCRLLLHRLSAQGHQVMPANHDAPA